MPRQIQKNAIGRAMDVVSSELPALVFGERAVIDSFVTIALDIV